MIQRTEEARWAAWVERMASSATAQLESEVEKLEAEGVHLYKLGLGEPDFSAPPHVQEAAIQAINDNFSKYTSTGGILALKQAIGKKISALTGVSYLIDEVMATVGGKHALFNAINALCRAGDEVIIPMPYWVSFPEQVKFAGGSPILIETDAASGYKLTPSSLEEAINEKTRILVLNSPNNPSGAAYSKEELKLLAEVCRRHDLWVISDEVYADFNYQAEGHQSIASVEEMRERTIIIYSLSKGYGMPGWRLGMAAGPAQVIGHMTKLQSHTTSNPSTIVQQAAAAALSGPQEMFATIKQDYAARRLAMIEGVRSIPGMRCEQPDGAFYVWVDISDWIGKTLGGVTISDADDFCRIVLERCRVVLMPGKAFGSGHHVRISFSASAEHIEQGLAIVKDWLASQS